MLHSFGLSSSCFKSMSPARAMAEAVRASEPFLGVPGPLFEIAENGPLDQRMLDSMRKHHPDVRLIAHGALAMAGRVHVDLSSMHLGESPAVVERIMQFLLDNGIGFWSLHAGNARHASMDQVLDRVRLLCGLHPGRIEVAVEGNPPAPGALLSSWDEYRYLLGTDTPYVVNTAHLEILESREGIDERVMESLFTSPGCRLIHVSGTDGRGMRRWLLDDEPWWLRYLDSSSPALVSEADHMAGVRSPRKTAMDDRMQEWPAMTARAA